MSSNNGVGSLVRGIVSASVLGAVAYFSSNMPAASYLCTAAALYAVWRGAGGKTAESLDKRVDLITDGGKKVITDGAKAVNSFLFGAEEDQATKKLREDFDTDPKGCTGFDEYKTKYGAGGTSGTGGSGGAATSAAVGVAMMYVGGVAVSLDPTDQGKYQALFNKVKNALKDCGMMEKKDVTMTINFKTGKGEYQVADRSQAKRQFDIHFEPLHHPDYTPERFALVQEAIHEFQECCKELSAANTGKGELLAEAVKALEGKVPADKITVNVLNGTYIVEGDKEPRKFAPELGERLEQIRREIKEQSESIDRFTVTDDPEKEKHPMGRVGSLKDPAQKCLSSCNWWNHYWPSATLTSEVPGQQMTAKETLELADSQKKYSDNLLRQRLDLEKSLLSGIKELETNAQKLSLEILKLMETEAESGAASAFDPKDLPSKLEQAVDVLISPELGRREKESRREAFVKRYEGCLKDIESYIPKIQESIKQGRSVSESIKEIKEEVSKRKSSLFIEAVIHAVDSQSQAAAESVIVPILTETIYASVDGNPSWKDKLVADYEESKGKELIERPRQDIYQVTDYINSVIAFMKPELFSYLNRIEAQFLKGDRSVTECFDDEIKSIVAVSASDVALHEERRKRQKRIIRRVLSKSDGSGAVKKKSAFALTDVYINSPMNQWVCRNYRHRIESGDVKETRWAEFEKCFEEAKAKPGMSGDKHEKIQALCNSFTLVVPSGCESRYEEFVIALGKSSNYSYTLPHGWQEIRNAAEEQRFERDEAMKARSGNPPIRDLLEEDLDPNSPKSSLNQSLGFGKARPNLETENQLTQSSPRVVDYNRRTKRPKRQA